MSCVEIAKLKVILAWVKNNKKYHEIEQFYQSIGAAYFDQVEMNSYRVMECLNRVVVLKTVIYCVTVSVSVQD